MTRLCCASAVAREPWRAKTARRTNDEVARRGNYTMKEHALYRKRTAFALAAVLLAGCASAPSPRVFPELVSLAPQPGMPDPLVMLDGRRVKTRAQWLNERRPELKELFAHYMYGAIPPKPARMQARVEGEYHDFLEGKATLKLLTLVTGAASNAPRIGLMLVVPNQGSRPAPVFLAMDFCANHAATEAGRGAQAADWPLAEIVRRGYALAAFYSGDVDSDRADLSSGVYAWLAGDDPAKNQPADRGTLAAWAWGFQRCVDYLVTDRDLDARRIAALGHSRNGKTALLAAAYDERIAIAFPHQAGCGGSAPSRGKVGESVKAINDRFPHWFNARFKQFNDAPERLPFDQHCLV